MRCVSTEVEYMVFGKTNLVILLKLLTLRDPLMNRGCQYPRHRQLHIDSRRIPSNWAHVDHPITELKERPSANTIIRQ